MENLKSKKLIRILEKRFNEVSCPEVKNEIKNTIGIIKEIFGDCETQLICSCGRTYIKKRNQYTNHCPSCPPPSKTKESQKEYMREYRRNQSTAN